MAHSGGFVSREAPFFMHIFTTGSGVYDLMNRTDAENPYLLFYGSIGFECSAYAANSFRSANLYHAHAQIPFAHALRVMPIHTPLRPRPVMDNA